MAAAATTREPTTGRLDDVTIALCGVSTASLTRTLYPDVFYAPHNSFHQEFYDTVDEVDENGMPVNRKIVWAGPRGLGKTRAALLGVGTRKTLYGLCDFGIYASASSDMAISQTENLKRRMLETKVIRATFGSIRTQRCEEMDEEFAKTGWVAKLPYFDKAGYIGTRWVPRGAKQQFRSSAFDKARPDHIHGDDLDDPRVIENEKQREEIKRWWFADVMPMVSQYNPNYQFIYTGTLTNRECLLAHLLRMSSWTHIRQSICTKDFRTVDPNYCTQERLDQMIAEYEEARMMAVFRREFMNEDDGGEMPSIDRSMFQNYDETEDQLNRDLYVQNAVVVDPANAPPNSSSRNAEVGIAGAGVNRLKDAIYIREIIGRKMWPEDMHRIAIDMARRINAKVIACEIQGGGIHVEQPFRDAIAMSGQNIRFMAIKASKMMGDFDVPDKKHRAKIARSAGLLPYYRRALVWHSPTNPGVRELEATLLSWPDCKRWDIVDPVAHLLTVMNMHEFTMLAPGKKRQDPIQFQKSLEALRRRQGEKAVVRDMDYDLNRLLAV